MNGLLDRQIPSSARALRVAGIEESKLAAAYPDRCARVVCARLCRLPDERALARVLLRPARFVGRKWLPRRKTRAWMLNRAVHQRGTSSATGCWTSMMPVRGALHVGLCTRT
jgi:hypothetical protein